MMNSILLALGSTSIIKISAVEKAFLDLFGNSIQISTTDTTSGVNEQPLGLEETLKGAKNRVEKTLAVFPDNYCLGIESGIIIFDDIAIDIAIIVGKKLGGEYIISTSTGLQFPNDCVSEAQEIGFETSVIGTVVVAKYGGNPKDPHSILTNNKFSRKD